MYRDITTLDDAELIKRIIKMSRARGMAMVIAGKDSADEHRKDIMAGKKELLLRLKRHV